MSLTWKIIWSVIVIIFGFAGVTAISEFFVAISDLFNDGGFTLSQIWTIFVAWLVILPMWFMWKGTKIVPIIFNLVVRIMLLVSCFFILPFVGGIIGNPWEAILGSISILLIYGFALYGIWVKS